MLTEFKIHRAGRIDQIVRDFFDKNPSVNELLAKELMFVFILKGIFAHAGPRMSVAGSSL